MEQRSKIESYIGFSIRAGKCTFGLNSVQTLKKAKVIIVCKSASDNTKKEGKKIANKLKAKLFFTSACLLDDYTHRENCKIIAIGEPSLAKAIEKNCENELIAGE